MKKKPTKIAVIMAAYNGIKWIAEQVDTILNQKNVKLHLYISIDPSQDGTEKWCKNLEKNKHNVTVLPTAQHFGSAAPNFFRLIKDIDFSKYDYIALADQDDIWHPNKISTGIKKIKQKSCNAYSSNVTAFWEDGTKTLINKAQKQVKWDFLFESAGPGCTFILEKKIITELQQIIINNDTSGIWLHDWFIYCYTRSQNYQWYIDKTPSMDYRQHNNNQVGINKGYKALRYRIKLIINGSALKQARLLAKLSHLENNHFVKKWEKLNRRGILTLILNAHNCRRKPRDKIYFAAACLITLITGIKK